jgi:hypothetical protein
VTPDREAAAAEAVDPSIRATLPAGAVIALALGGLLLMGMLATLIAVLVSLEGTRSEIRTTRAHLTNVDQRVERVTGQLSPLAAGVAPLTTPQARRDLKATTRALPEAVAQLPSALRALRALTDAALMHGRLPRALDGADGFFSALQQPGAASQATCDARLRRRAPIVAGQIGCLLRTAANARTLLSSQRRLTGRSVRVQLDNLGLTRQVVQLMSQSLAVQRETLAHVRAVDRKLPGPTG